MIEVKDVKKRFGTLAALDGLCMHVKKGSIYGLVGENGAGKTTLINHITGVLKQDEGSVKIGGENVWENIELKKKILSIADDWFYYGSYSVDDMKNFYKSIYPSFSDERYKKLEDAFSIGGRTLVRTLSKGMKKQAAFKIVLSCMPEVLVLDEPLDGLDPVMRKQILSFIISDVSERDMTVVVSSHNLRELEDMCDAIGIMHKGKMLLEKSLEDLDGYVHKFQAAFSGGFPENLKKELDIRSHTAIGALNTFIVRGEADKITEAIKRYSPVVCEHVKLTLEEIFIYELGGAGYDVKNIII